MDEVSLSYKKKNENNYLWIVLLVVMVWDGVWGSQILRDCFFHYSGYQAVLEIEQGLLPGLGVGDGSWGSCLD